MSDGTKVLVFEHDAAFAGELRHELTLLGCVVSVVDDGNAGLTQAAADRPDLILLSIELPRMNGFSVCNKLKKDPQLKEVPLIIMSSESSEETFEQHKKLRTRAEDYVRKPIAFGELLQHIGALIPGLASAEGGDGGDSAIVIDDELMVDSLHEPDGEPEDEMTQVGAMPQAIREQFQKRAAAAAPKAQSVHPQAPDAEMDAFADAAFDNLLGNSVPPPANQPPPSSRAGSAGVNPMAGPRPAPVVAPPTPPRPLATPAPSPSPVVAPRPAAAGAAVSGPSSSDASEMERLRKSEERARAELLRLERDLATARAEVGKLKAAQSKGKLADETQTRLQSELDAATKALTSARADAEAARSELAEVRAKVEAHPIAIGRLQGELDDALTRANQLNEAQLSSSGEQAAELGRLHGELADARAEARRSEAESQTAQLESKQAAEALAEARKEADRARDLEAETKRLREELDKAKAASLTPAPAAAAKSGGVSTREFLELRETLNKKDKEILALKDELNAHEKGVLDVKDRLFSAERAAVEQDDRLAEAQRIGEEALAKIATIEAASADNARASEASIAAYRHELDEAGKAKSALESALAAAQAAVEAARTEAAATLARSEREADARMAEATRERARLAEEHDKAIANATDAHEAERRKLAEQHEVERRRLADEHDKVRAIAIEEVRSQLQNKVNEVEARASSLELDLAGARGALSTAEQTQTKTMRELTDARSLIVSLEKKFTEATRELAATRERLETETTNMRKANEKGNRDRASLERAKDALAEALVRIEETERGA